MVNLDPNSEKSDPDSEKNPLETQFFLSGFVPKIQIQLGRS